MFKLFSTDSKLSKHKEFMIRFRDKFEDMTNMLIKYHAIIKSQEKDLKLLKNKNELTMQISNVMNLNIKT